MKKNLRLLTVVVGIIALASVFTTTLGAGIVIVKDIQVINRSLLGGGSCNMSMNCSQYGCHNNSNMTTITGVLLYQNSNFKIGTTILSFGCYNYINTTISPYDFDGDGTIETILNELLGMVGTSITVEGYLRCMGTKLNVYYINGILYREC